MSDAKSRNTLNKLREKELEEQRKRDEEALKEEKEINQEIKVNSRMLKGCYLMLVIMILLPELKPYIIATADEDTEMVLNFTPKIVPILCLLCLIFGIWTHRKELIEKARVLAERNARIVRPAYNQ